VNPLTATEPLALERDVQAEPDTRGVPIDDVGIRGLRYPLPVSCRDGQAQPVVATVELAVSLSAKRRGTHMSRFVETLDDWSGEPLDGARMLAMTTDIAARLDSGQARASIGFTLFLQRRAPVSGLPSKLGIDCRFDATVAPSERRLTVGVRVPVTSLCPCSKEISDYGAHNQRGYVAIDASVDPAVHLALEDLIDVAEASGSAPIYPLLKRVDERFVTMQAYDAPAFVEDVVREVALELRGDQRLLGFAVEAENHESIHDHSAVASVRWQRET
jgi:GTP cyclohydrolase IB